MRTFKSQRSWLDYHNVSSVIALPFFLTVTFTGLAIFFYLYLPWGMQKLYPENPYQYFNDIRTKTVTESTTPHPAQNLPVEKLLAQLKQRWGNQTLATMSVKTQIRIRLKLRSFSKKTILLPAIKHKSH